MQSISICVKTLGITQHMLYLVKVFAETMSWIWAHAFLRAMLNWPILLLQIFPKAKGIICYLLNLRWVNCPLENSNFGYGPVTWSLTASSRLSWSSHFRAVTEWKPFHTSDTTGRVVTPSKLPSRLRMSWSRCHVIDNRSSNSKCGS